MDTAKALIDSIPDQQLKADTLKWWQETGGKMDLNQGVADLRGKVGWAIDESNKRAAIAKDQALAGENLQRAKYGIQQTLAASRPGEDASMRAMLAARGISRGGAPYEGAANLESTRQSQAMLRSLQAEKDAAGAQTGAYEDAQNRAAQIANALALARAQSAAGIAQTQMQTSDPNAAFWGGLGSVAGTLLPWLINNPVQKYYVQGGNAVT